MSDKVITTFQERRQLEAAIAALGATSTETALNRQVKIIVQEYEPSLVLTVLRKHLNTSSSQLRGGLGRLAALLPHEETVSLLRREAVNRSNPTQARLTAALILERFLQVEISPALMGDLKDPEVVVMQSLQEALDEGRSNSNVLLEYVRQMRQEDEGVAFLVLDLLGRQPPSEQVDLLRLIAYDGRPSVAEAALDRLSTLRQEDVAAQAAASLHILQYNLTPALARRAERNLRKMRFAGVAWQPSVPAGWRALLSPCDFQGSQDLWFLDANPEDEGGVLIGLRINAVAGILEAFGSEMVERQYLPPPRQIGEMVSIALSNNIPTVFLETPFAYAHWRLLRTLKAHWTVDEKRSLPEEYTLYNSYIFRYQKPSLDDNLAELLGAGPALWEQEGHRLDEITTTFLRHPAMAGWFLQDRRMWDILRKSEGEVTRASLQDTVTALITAAIPESAEQELIVQFQEALWAQAGWLAIAGYRHHAQHAVLLAESFVHISLRTHPLLLQMFEIGLRLLANQRSSGADVLAG